MNLLSLSQSTNKTQASIPVQVTGVVSKETGAKKPFFSATISDASHSASVNFWCDTGAFSELDNNRAGGFYFLEAEFQKNSFGLNLGSAVLRHMNQEEKASFLSGGEELLAKSECDWNEIIETARAIDVTPIRIVLLSILEDPKLQAIYRRAAAAVKFHHARRGGLVSHTASMLRVAKSIAPLYEDVCPSLLFAGLIMHDFGKILENDTFDGFAAVPTVAGELLGHITVGATFVDRHWRECSAAHPEVFAGSGDIRLHWMHLILSHHGQKDYGSPVTPRIPEAFILHHIDMLDAQMEMIRTAYATITPNAQGLIDAGFPLKVSLITPISRQLSSASA